MAARKRPVWRILFDAAEQRVGPAAEQLVRTDGFADAVGLVTRLNQESKRRAERALRQGWHLFNLPAGSDVKRLSEQVGRLERQVRDLRRQLDETTKGERHGGSGRSAASATSRRPRQG